MQGFEGLGGLPHHHLRLTNVVDGCAFSDDKHGHLFVAAIK